MNRSASAFSMFQPMKCTDRSARTIRRFLKPRRMRRTVRMLRRRHASDHLVRAYFHTYGLPVLTTNCSNNYGPYHFPEKLIPLMILNGLEGKQLPVYGDGKNVRDWLYVEDHCSAIRAVLDIRQAWARPTTSAARANARISMWSRRSAICWTSWPPVTRSVLGES